MSNGHDKPGTNLVLSIAGLDAAAQTALLEAQPTGYYIVAATTEFLYLYKGKKK